MAPKTLLLLATMYIMPTTAYPVIPHNCSYVNADATSRHVHRFNKVYGHVVCRPTTIPRGQLLLFVGGTGPNDYTAFPRVAAEIGFHAFSLDWINHPSAGSTCGIYLAKRKNNPDTSCNGPDIHPECETCTLALQKARLMGSQAPGAANPAQTIDAYNSIIGRTVALLQYMQVHEPYNNWQQFLEGPNHTSLNWSTVTVAGHSRGSSYPPLVSKLFPARRAVSVGGIADVVGNVTGDPEYGGRAPKWLSEMPQVMPLHDVYALNPGFEGTTRKSLDYHALTQGITGNATFTRAQAASGPSALAKVLGGARLIFDSEICANTTSPHMCVGTCDGWQPVDQTGYPLLAPLWKYLLLNTDPPSPRALATQISDSMPHWQPPNCAPTPDQPVKCGDPIDRRHPDFCPSCAKHGCPNCGLYGHSGEGGGEGAGGGDNPVQVCHPC